MAKEGGIGNTEYDKVKIFADWLCSAQTMKNIQNAVINYPGMKEAVELIFERSQIATMKLEENLRKKSHKLENTNPYHLMYKLCILMMLADRIPHPKELKLIEKILDSQNWIIDFENHDTYGSKNNHLFLVHLVLVHLVLVHLVLLVHRPVGY